MKKLLTTVIAIYSAAFFLAGCGKDGGGGNAAVPPAGGCGVGQVWNGSLCVVGTGINVPNGKVQYYDYNKFYTYNMWGSANTVSGDMTISNTAAFKAFLKEAMGVCDRNIWGWETGSADCDRWVSGSFQLSLSVDSSLKPAVRFEAVPTSSYFNGSIGIDNGTAAFNPLILNQNNTFSLINNSQGFEIRAQGSYWNGGGLRLIQIQVLQGTLNDAFVAYDLYYPLNNVPTKFASGKLKRY